MVTAADWAPYRKTPLTISYFSPLQRYMVQRALAAAAMAKLGLGSESVRAQTGSEASFAEMLPETVA